MTWNKQKFIKTKQTKSTSMDNAKIALIGGFVIAVAVPELKSTPA